MKDKQSALARLKIIEDEAKALRAEIEAPEHRYYEGQYGAFSDRYRNAYEDPDPLHGRLEGIASDGRFIKACAWKYFTPIIPEELKLHPNQYLVITENPKWL